MYYIKLTKKLLEKINLNIEKYGRNTKEKPDNELLNEKNISKYYNFYFSISYKNKGSGEESILGGLKKLENDDKRELLGCIFVVYNKDLITFLDKIFGDNYDQWNDDNLLIAEYEIDFIYGCINDLRKLKEEEKNEIVLNFINFVEVLFKNEYSKMDKMIKNNKIDFESLWYYFDIPGKVYKTKTFKEWMCYKHDHYRYIDNKSLILSGKIITVLGGKLEYKKYNFAIEIYKGFKNLNEFNIFKLTDECKKDILDNTEKILNNYKNIKHMYLDGNHLIPHNKSFILKKRSERVMVDSVECGENTSNPWGEEKCEWNLDVEGNEINILVDDLKEEDKLIIAPFLGIYNLGIFKKWGFAHIKYLKEVNYNEKAFDYLVLDEKKKDIIMSLVKNYKNEYKDFIINKGEGIVFLLHGNPGVGKTLTAEATCEYLKKPLYIINVADLGLNPDVVELNLENILKLCERWDAILLLDEADIFLESRNISDINRNAIVCLFLKYLEFHKGIIFLTTNRLDTLDIAVKSRINLSLHYQDLTSGRRLEIWKSLLGLWKINLDEKILKKISNFEMNGREIRNTMKIVFSLLKSRKQEVNGKNILKCLEECYKLKTEFSDKVKTTSLYM